jgi:hypothetical protein
MNSFLALTAYAITAQVFAPRCVYTAAPVYQWLRRRFSPFVANLLWLPQGTLVFVILRVLRLIRRIAK